MKVFKEFESPLKIVSQTQVLYTSSYFSFYFLGFGNEWEAKSTLVGTLIVLQPKCENLRNLYEGMFSSILL